MCDCYFNDEFAKKAHVKGRRHRLNYKKMYQPSLYVEPTKSMVSHWGNVLLDMLLLIFPEKGDGKEEENA